MTEHDINNYTKKRERKQSLQIFSDKPLPLSTQGKCQRGRLDLLKKEKLEQQLYWVFMEKTEVANHWNIKEKLHELNEF